MDLSKILSSYDDDGDDDSGRHEPPPRSPRTQHYHPPLPPPPPPSSFHHHNQQQQQRHGHDWSADEMRCAVSILQDFHQPDDAAPSAAPFALPRVRVVHDERKSDNDDDDDPMDATYAPRHSSAAATSGWASSSDLMSKLDLLVQADEIIQSAAAASAHHQQQLNGTTGASATVGFARSGVWLLAEEEYAAALIYYFLKGLLPLREGTTLRKFLAEQLCCNRRRVSMKLATESIAGKRIPRKVGASVFVVAPDATTADRAMAAETLEALRARCFDPLASPTLESRPRPSKQHDELPELLLSEPSAAPTGPTKRWNALSSPHRFGDNDNDSVDRKPSVTAEPHRPARPTVSTTATSSNRSVESTPKKPKPLRTYRPVPAPELLRSPPGTGNIKRRKPTIIRTGFETREEEQYVTRLVEYFLAGALELPDGTRLVTFLCAQLACSPKTLSMKLAPRRLGERRFPDNVGSITYMRQDARAPKFARATVDATLATLRTACFDYAHTTPTPLQPPFKSPNSLSLSLSQRPATIETLSPTITGIQSERKQSSASSSVSPSGGSFSRSGAWSRDEELYAAGLIDAFFKGVLEVSEGTTLRALLATRLRCNPMRVSKKLASEWIADIKIPKKLGSSTFVRRSPAVTEAADDELRALERAFLRSEATGVGREGDDDDVDGAVIAGMKHARAEEEEEEDEDEEDERLAASSSPESSSSEDESEEEEEEVDDDKARVKEEEDVTSPRKVRRVLSDDDKDVDVKSEPQLAMAY